jgi:hypothetical protein
MASEFGLFLPLWSFAADEGALLERVAGEVPLDFVSVPVVTGPVSQLSLTSRPEAPFFHTEGGWHFPPTRELYGAIDGKPPKARWFGNADVLARFRERLADLGLELVCRVDLRNIPALLERAPHLAQRNAWGQPMPQCGLCVSHPDARELLQQTLTDLERYEPAGFELVDWVPNNTDPSMVWHTQSPHQLGRCFCPSCRTIASRSGPDAEEGVTIWEELVRAGSAWRAPAVDPEADRMRAFNACRREDLAAWFAACAPFAAPRRSYMLQAYPANWLLGPPDLMEQIRDPRLIERARTKGLNSAVAMSICPYAAFFDKSDELVRFVSEAGQEGVRRFVFEGLDDLPAEALTWVKQAVRFARRE